MARGKITIEIDYPVNLEHYPPKTTVEEAVGMDQHSWDNGEVDITDLVAWADDGDDGVKVTFEAVNDD